MNASLRRVSGAEDEEGCIYQCLEVVEQVEEVWGVFVYVEDLPEEELA